MQILPSLHLNLSLNPNLVEREVLSYASASELPIRFRLDLQRQKLIHTPQVPRRLFCRKRHVRNGLRLLATEQERENTAGK